MTYISSIPSILSIMSISSKGVATRLTQTTCDMYLKTVDLQVIEGRLLSLSPVATWRSHEAGRLQQVVNGEDRLGYG